MTGIRVSLFPCTRLALLTVLILLTGVPPTSAHVIPEDASFAAFIKPEGTRLRVLLRAPLSAMVDLTYPTRGSTDLLDLDRADQVLRELASLWIADNLELREGTVVCPRPTIVEVRASLAFDRSFVSYEQALQHVRGTRLTNAVDFIWNQGFLDVLLEYPIISDRSLFGIHSRLSTLAVRTTTRLRYLGPEGEDRTFEYIGDPGVFALNPSSVTTATRFLLAGFTTVVQRLGWWLFAVLLAVPLRNRKTFLAATGACLIAQAITVSPSSTLTVDTLWFLPLIEVLISACIVSLAIANGVTPGTERRWMAGFVAGLLLGLRGAATIRPELQFAGAHPWAALVGFAIGADAAQLLLFTAAAAAGWLLWRAAPARAGIIVVSLLAGDLAWHQLLADGNMLRRYQVELPVLTPQLALAAVGWMLNAILALAVFWLVAVAVRRFGQPEPHRPISEAPR